MADDKKQFPPQQQQQPGKQFKMDPQPDSKPPEYSGGGRLQGKRAIITGGDSGIGRAVAIAFAREGADVSILYLSEHKDAEETRREVEKAGARCLTISGDIGNEVFCRKAVEQTVEQLGGLEILVNNAGEQHERESIMQISEQDLDRTFRTNIYSMFFMTKAALEFIKSGSVIVNSTSVTAYQGHATLLDYATTKGAIVSFTRSLALHLADRHIRVNAVAPGPVWTPLIPASFDKEKVQQFGANTPMQRAGQPGEIAPSYVFLASDDSSYMTGQVLHPNGGRIVNG
jgi:NAD(P)-dependent dehydrogenase (short-subunit alcohol dehydrogenase family)